MLRATLLAVLGTLVTLSHGVAVPIHHQSPCSVDQTEPVYQTERYPPTSPNPLGVVWTNCPNRQAICSSHVHVTSSGLDTRLPRALWDDCRQLLDEIKDRDQRGIFTITRPGGHPDKDFFYDVVQHKSCFFSISPGCDGAEVGDVDLRRVLHGALQKTSRGGTMAAEGEMMCRKSPGWKCIHHSKWRLYGDLETDDEGCKIKEKKKGKKGKKGKGKKKDKRAESADVQGHCRNDQ